MSTNYIKPTYIGITQSVPQVGQTLEFLRIKKRTYCSAEYKNEVTDKLISISLDSKYFFAESEKSKYILFFLSQKSEYFETNILLIKDVPVIGRPLTALKFIKNPGKTEFELTLISEFTDVVESIIYNLGLISFTTVSGKKYYIPNDI